MTEYKRLAKEPMNTKNAIEALQGMLSEVYSANSRTKLMEDEVSKVKLTAIEYAVEQLRKELI